MTRWEEVLILVLVEYGLGATEMQSNVDTVKSLNPCFGGIWSRRVNFVYLCEPDC